MVMRGRGAVLLVAAGVLVAGCTGEAAPVEPTGVTTPEVTTPSASLTPSPTPTRDEAPSPPAPSADTQGAEVAARYVIDVLNHASATADVAEWNRITAPTCETCVAFTNDITAAGPDPHGEVRIESAKTTEINPGAFYTVALIVEQDPFTEPDGAPNAGGRFAFLLALRFTDIWVVEALDVAAPDAPWAS